MQTCVRDSTLRDLPRLRKSGMCVVLKDFRRHVLLSTMVQLILRVMISFFCKSIVLNVSVLEVCYLVQSMWERLHFNNDSSSWESGPKDLFGFISEIADAGPGLGNEALCS